MGNGKSIFLSLFLTFWFGPLGVFYSSVLGGVLMTGITLFGVLASAGIGLIIFWPMSMVWGAAAAFSNKGRQP